MYDLLVPHRGLTPPPWPLTLHFTNFPTSTLPSYTGDFPLRTSYINSLKEAAFISCGTATPVMNMVPQAREDLWQAVLEGNIKRYNQILHSVPLKTPEGLEAIPVRVFLRNHSSGEESSGGLGGYLSSYEGAIVQTSRPIAVNKVESGEPVRLGEALVPIISKWVMSQKVQLGKKGGKNEEKDVDDSISGSVVVEESDVKEESMAWDAVGYTSKILSGFGGLTDAVDSVFIQGVEPSPDVILRDLHAALHCPDFFLYIVLHMKPIR